MIQYENSIIISLFLDETKEILKAGKDQGNFRINFHGEELNYLGSAEVCRISLCISSHLIHLIK